jgi:S1-C subfamily serine protease
MKSGGPPAWRTLGVELAVLPLAEARERGLEPKLAAELEGREDAEPRVLAVRRLLPGAPAASALRVGDLLVRVDGRAVTRFREVERAAQAEQVTLTVARGPAVHELTLATVPVDGVGTSEALLFAGALLQAPPIELASQWGIPREGVYVAGSFRGSPAERHRLTPTLRILAVGAVATPNLEAFRSAVAGREDGDTLRLRVVDLEGRTQLLAVEFDRHDWPNVLLKRTDSGWQRVDEDGTAP